MKIVWGRSIGFNISLNCLDRYSTGGAMDYTIITDGADCYPWMETFIMWPRKSVTGKRLFWEKAFKRRVWVVWGTGFHMEPEVQYADIFEVLTYDDKHNTR